MVEPVVRPSFFENLYLILAGRDCRQALEDFRNGRTTKRALQRIAAATPIPTEHVVHLFACADEFCDLLAALDEPRATDIAKRHRYLLWSSSQQSESDPFGRHRFRVPTLIQLSALAQKAKRSDTGLDRIWQFGACLRVPRAAHNDCQHQRQDWRHYACSFSHYFGLWRSCR